MTKHSIDFRAAFEALPGNFLVLQPDPPHFTIITVSDELLRITHRERPHVTGKSVFEVYPENPETIADHGPSGLRCSLENVIKYKKQELVPTIRYDVSNASGVYEERYWSVCCKPVLSPDGEILYIVHSAVDVTDRVKAEKKEKELREIEKKYSLLMQAPVPVGILTGPDNIVELANEAILKLFGRSTEVIGRPLSDALPEAREQGFPDILDQVRTTGESWYSAEKAVRLVNGEKEEELFFTFVFRPWYENPGDQAPAGVFCVANNVTEQVLARKKVEESGQQLRSFVESAPFPIAVYTGREMRIRFANKAMIDVYGKGSDVTGSLYAEVLPEMAPEIYKRLDEVFTKGIPFHARNEKIEVVKGGKPQSFFYNYHFTPLYDSEGKVYGVMNTAADVTDLYLARKKTEESVIALKNLANAMPQVVWIAEANGKVSYYNDRISEFSGAQKLPDGTWVWENILHPDDLEFTSEAWDKALKEGSVYEKEHRLKMKDGSFRWHLSRAFPQRNKKGTIIKWYGTATDVHEQKANEEALRRSEEQLRIAVEGAELGAFYYYPQTGKKIWALKTKEMMGLSPEAEVVPETFSKALHPDDRARSEHLVKEALRSENGGLYENEFRIVRFSDGEVRWMRSKGKARFDEEGNAVWFTGVMQDITKRKQSEEALEMKNTQLIRINNDLDNFIYTASHDLKAPINNIEGLLQVLKLNIPAEVRDSERVQRITAMMQESTERFKKTIANLTEVVKLRNENNGEAVSVNLEEVIKEVQMDLDPMIQASGVQPDVDVQECRTIHFSEKNLRSVVYNLLSNAIKYRSPEREPKVQIRCERIGDFDVLSVKDNGLGIPKERMGQLFSMFKRFHAHVEGSGIGLYMVKKMVENAGGHIQVKSQTGEGSVFRVFFKR